MDRVCPMLGLAGDRRSAVDGIDSAHRCHAELPPLPLERQYQAQYCLTTNHERCERYLGAVARAGGASLGRSPIADGLVSTRMVLAPDPAWRGMAGRARRARPGPLLAIGALGVVAATGIVALADAVLDGRLDLSVLVTAEESASPSPSPSVSASPSPSPTVRPTPTPSPTPSPTPTPTPVPTPVPPTPAPTPPPVTTYVVEEGDTLAAIAQQFGTTVEAIQAANGIEDPDTIAVGQILVIP